MAASKYENYIDSGIDWLGKIPSSWSQKNIGSLYTLRNTKVSDTEYPPLSVTMKGVVPQLETAAKSDAHDDRKLVKKGDFAINSRSDRRGSCGISNYDGSVSLINTILTPRGEMNPSFYDWLFHTIQFGDEFYKNGHGIVDDLWTTSWQEMKKITVVVPPLSEQVAIANYLNDEVEKVDDLLEDISISIEEYKDWKIAIIFEALTKGLNSDVKYKDCGINWIGEIPSHWNISKIKYGVTKVGSGKTPRGGAEVYSDEGVLFLRSQNVYDTGLYLDNPTYISEEVDEEMANTRVYPGDVLLNITGGSIGRCCVFPEGVGSANVNQHVSIIRVKRNVFLPEYIHYYWMSALGKNAIGIYQTGGNREGMSADAIKNSPIPVMPIDEQKSIIDYLDPICSNIDALIMEKSSLIKDLEEYKKALIFECVTGKRKVV